MTKRAAVFRKSKIFGTVAASENFCKQTGKFSESEACLGGRYVLPGQRAGPRDRLPQFRLENRLFLFGKNLRHLASHGNMTL